MKSRVLAGISFLIAIFALSGTVFADQLSSYSIDAELTREGVTNVKLVMVYSEPVGNLNFFLPVKISNFNATSSAGGITCDNKIDTVTLISCSLNLTESRKTVEMTFQSSDMIKSLQGKFLFTSDFGLRIPSSNVFAAVRLPEGMVLSQNVPGDATVPFTNSTSTDGRIITVLWRLSDVGDKPLNFQVFYEPVIDQTAPSFGVPPLRVLVLLGIIFGGGIGLIFLRRYRKTQEVVFSVLDDYEKRVISSIQKAEGPINQKRVVIDTNLSKAKVSRVVRKLVERGLIEVERRGRTNIIKFSKRKFGS